MIKGEKNDNDLISREALKEQVKELLDLAVKRVNDTPTNSPCYRMYVEQENERARLIDLIDNAPTVEPEQKERPKGEWIKHSTYKDVLICSNCNHGSNQVYDTFSFCPNCGADMKGGAE